VLASAGKILNRMIELKGLSDDVMKNDSDSENYNREFKDLQMQIYDMAALKFNGVSMFATTAQKTGGAQAVFDNLNQSKSLDNTVSIFVSSDGNTGPIVSVNKALLLSALTIDSDSLQTGKAYTTTQTNGNYTTGDDVTFAAANEGATINLSDISVGVFTQAIQNIATLRANNGASMSRLRFAGEEMGKQETNLIAANGRIVDVDIAAESTRMAKYNVLVQASASMLAQANSSADIALMLLR
jgi:flagellin